MTSAVSSASCPRCGDTNVQPVPVRRSGSAAPEPVRHGAPGTAPIAQCVCARCGCRWTPRSPEERHLRALSGQLGEGAARAAQAEDAARARREARRARLPKVPARTWFIAATMAAVILLALLT